MATKTEGESQQDYAKTTIIFIKKIERKGGTLATEESITFR